MAIPKYKKHMKYFVYVLYNISSGRFYVGFTLDLERRLIEHKNSKLSHRNKDFNPVLIEIYYNEQDALKREKYFKSSKGKSTLRAMLRYTLETV